MSVELYMTWLVLIQNTGVPQCDQREILGMEEGGASPSFVWLESQLVLLCRCEVCLQKEAVVPGTRAAAGPRELPLLELALTCKVQENKFKTGMFSHFCNVTY